MNRFFSKVRSALLRDRAFSRYLLYALGEILLVVLGILIALQIDNWNEDRKERKREAAILEKLHREFSENLTEFQRIYELNQGKLKDLDTLLFYLRDPEQPGAMDRISAVIWNAVIGEIYNPSRGTVESLINSGNIDLIRNDTLRDYLTSWPYKLEYYKEEEEFDQSWVFRLPEYMVRNGSFREADAPFGSILSEREFYNNIAMRQNSLNQLIWAADHEGIREVLEGIVRLTKPGY